MMKTSSSISPGRCALTYALVATVWICATDLVPEFVGGTEDHHHALLHVLRSAALVLTSAGALFVLLQRLVNRIEQHDVELRRQEERWRVALDGVGDGLWDWNVKTGEVYYSARLQEQLGYKAGEFDSRVEEWSGRLHPDDRAGAFAEVERHLRGETSVYRHEHRLLARDGTYRWMLDRAMVVERDDAGRPERMIGTHSDITVHKQMEEQLREQALRYQTLFEQNPHPMWIYLVESRRIVAVNDFAIEKYGYSRAEFLEKTIFDIRPREDVPTLLRHLAQETPPVQTSGPWRHQKANGETILVEVMSHRITWKGMPARVVVAHDITLQQRAVNEIAESEQKFRAIFENANDAIFIADENYIITGTNPKGLELFRAGEKQLVGHRVTEFFPKHQPDGSNSLRKARALLDSVWKTRLAAPFEWVHRRPDGTTFPSESTLSGLVHEGRRSIVVVVRDITERRRSTERLELLQAALEATPAGVVITTAEGEIDWVNPAFTRLTGYSLEEVAGQNPRLLRSGEHDPQFYRAMWDTITRGEVWAGEIQNRRKDGTLYQEHMTIAPVRDAAKHITHYIAVKEDVTSERQLEQQLARAQRLESVGMLASGIAHDLNNVLTPIILTTELLKSANGSSVLNDRLDLVGQAAQRGANIVKQVLTFARGVDGERTNVQPRYVVKEVAQLAEETFPRNIEIRVEAARDLAEVVANVTQLHQVLLNLAVNARDAMPSGGRLVFGVRHTLVDESRAKILGRIEPGEFVDITVSDTGTGMSEEVLEHMFEPFFTTKPRGKGTGLGLSTVYGIVRSHGGAVEVQTALGRGTTFHVLLPIPRTPASAQQPAPATEEMNGDGRLVLLVDDEEPIRIVGEHILRRQGFEVVTAADGVQALGLFQLRPHAYALAIIDQMMPKMGGLTLIRELRTLAPGLKVISSTGLGAEPGAEQTEAEELSRLGVRTRLPKPYTSNELMDALRRELEGVAV